MCTNYILASILTIFFFNILLFKCNTWIKRYYFNTKIKLYWIYNKLIKGIYCGDADHCYPLASGRGMNLGMEDAWVLVALI